MALRNVLQQNRVIVTVLFIAIIMGSLFSIFTQLTKKDESTGLAYTYFYDLSSGEVFTDKSSLIAPIRDGNGVRAAVFSCGTCEDQASHFVGWIEMYTPQAKQAAHVLLQEDTVESAEMTMAIDKGRLIAPKPQQGSKPQWMVLGSPQGINVMQIINDRCSAAGDGSSRLTACTPAQR